MATEKELFDRAVALRHEVDALADDVLDMDPTIELCVFAGNVGAVGAVLDNLIRAGVPVADGAEGPPKRPISNELQIKTYLHCSLCIQEKPPGMSPREYASVEIGATEQGFQVWCKRHECNVVHIDFEGRQHPANTKRHSEPELDS